MLDTIRKRKENIFYTFIILAVVIVMGFFGIGNMGGDENGKDGVAAWVNGEPITQREFRQTLEYKLQEFQARLGGQLDEKLLDHLRIPERTLDELVQYKLLSQQAKKLGVLVPDSELAEHIRSSPGLQKDGKFDAEAYAKIPNRGYEEKRQRERLQTMRFQNYLAERIRLTPTEIQKEFVLKESKVDLEYAKIDFAALAPTASPTKAQLDIFLKDAPEADLQSYYDAHKSEFASKAQANIKQIRVGVPFKAGEAVKKEAKNKIEAIAKEVNAGNFEQVAKAKSDDEYAKKGGVVGWVTRGSLEKPLEEAIDKLTAGNISPVVETSFGYFVLQLIEKKDSIQKPLAEVKPAVAESVWKEKDKQRFIEEKKKAWEVIVANGQPLDSELKKYKVELKKTGSFPIGQGYVPNVGQIDSLLDAVFDLTKEKPVAKKLFFFQDSYYYVKLLKMDLPKKEDFAKSAETVEKGVVMALQGELLNSWMKDLQKNSKVKTEVAFGGAQHPESDNN